MQFFKKLITQITGAANDALDAASDDSRTVRQSVRDMQEDIEKATLAVADVNAQKTLIANRITEATAAAKDWGSRAERAVTLGDDALASAALEQQVIEEGRMAKYTEQLNDLQPQVEKLNALLNTRKEQLENAKIDSDVIQANSAVADATMTAAKALTATGAAGILADAKTAIDKKAATADALLELTEDKGEAMTRKLRELETNSNVSERLASLKANVASLKAK